ncbi:MAG TPA: VCBS repeat-containing protein [Verrucomicrobiae bacterium]|nr:VCBS repeat-containing protein [Verrucomicrobiae bacterium]
MISLKCAVSAAGWVASLVFAIAQPTNALFSFGGPEIFPIDPLVGQLRIADFDGDGLQDIAIANNTRSKITILYNQTGRTNSLTRDRGFKRELNELPPDARFQIESIASEKRIASMVAADLNNDGRPDIAYYGEPKELVVQFNEGTNVWSAPKRWAIGNGQLTPNALSAGDLNGDNLADLVLLGENTIHFIPQLPNRLMGEPERIPLSAAVKSVQVLDVDGDGRDDLLLVNWEDRNPFRFRLQKADGALGPEMYFSMAPIRSYWADNLEEDGKVQVMTIAQNSGRAQVSQFNRRDAEPLSGTFKLGQFEVLPLNRTDKARRGMAWADVNGDGLEDLLVAEPESGQIALCLQTNGGIGNPRVFPTLAGVTDISAGDWDGDKRPEIFLLSADERQIGVMRMDQHSRLPFPSFIPMDGRPLAMAVGAVNGTNRALAVIVDQEGRRALITCLPNGTTRVQKLGENFRANPSSIAIHDADQDGLMDVVILVPYERIKVLRQKAGGSFEEIDVTAPGGALDQPWLSSADVDGDKRAELLLPQRNFLRAVVLQANAAQESTNRGGWGFRVKEQINGAASDSRIAGAAAVPNGTNSVASLFLLDAERKALTLCERDANAVWRVVRNVDLPMATFNQLHPVALGGRTTNAVTMLGLNTVAWLSLEGSTWSLTELDGYETPIRNAYLTDVVSGDLNNDRRKDLVFLETGRNYLDLVIFSAEHKLVPANRWQVFEERTFRSRRADLPEPREAAVADVTGDGRNDLIVLVHDRVLVYPQE